MKKAKVRNPPKAHRTEPTWVVVPLNLGKRLHRKVVELAERLGMDENDLLVEIIRGELDGRAAKGDSKC
jgi:hypothetical protein